MSKMEAVRARDGPEIVLSAQSTASVAAVAAQSGQKTPQERPKSDPERPRAPQSVPRASQERPKSVQGVARGPKLEAKGGQDAQKMKPESQHKRKSRNVKNIKKHKEN